MGSGSGVICGIIVVSGVFWGTAAFARELPDTDFDGLSNHMEELFHTNSDDPDTDSDGYPDGLEVENGYDPLHGNASKLPKHIEVNLKKQRLQYFLGGVPLGELVISSGKWNLPTPKGSFVIQNKYPRPWSRLAKLWMPEWMGFAGGKFGIHQLPEWPNGRREGESHLGTPVSHGCIRLGEKDARFMYNWTPIGTQLTIK